MKKISVLALFGLALFAFAACNSVRNSGELTTVSGKWNRSIPEKLYLYKIVNGSLAEIASSSIYEDSTFCFATRPSKGDFYYIGPGKLSADRYAFYLKPGDNLNFTVTANSYTLNGNNSPENREVAKWHDFIQPLEWKAVYFDKENSTYVDFFPLLEEKLKALEDYPKNVTANRDFNQAFEEYKKFNLLDIAIHFIYTPRTAHPEGEDFPAYYRNMDISALTQTTAIMKYSPAGINNIENIIFNRLRLENQKITNPLDAIMENISKVANDTLKGEMVVKFAAHKKTLAGFAEYREQYGKYLVTKNQKTRMRELELALNDAKDGSPAMDFKFADKDGKQVALSDFKGKLVYIDIWATWCGPCKQELPHLKKLEEEYRNNKNIVFLSVSTDASKDHQKWKDYLAKEDLKGVQLFAGDDARDGIIKPYKVSGIPRFVLVGKDGTILSSDAPRPSSPEIRPLLKANL
ncbi:MAG: TlpA family protein disulfide reductase [Prevotellaceae bacterium]|jgi:thiol-disulfide isomerase/thioredoxin|nr:TlpA family protein disulfide reductase [Prevotellaceae bacterium]